MALPTEGAAWSICRCGVPEHPAPPPRGLLMDLRGVAAWPARSPRGRTAHVAPPRGRSGALRSHAPDAAPSSTEIHQKPLIHVGDFKASGRTSGTTQGDVEQEPSRAGAEGGRPPRRYRPVPALLAGALPGTADDCHIRDGAPGVAYGHRPCPHAPVAGGLRPAHLTQIPEPMGSAGEFEAGGECGTADPACPDTVVSFLFAGRGPSDHSSRRHQREQYKRREPRRAARPLRPPVSHWCPPLGPSWGLRVRTWPR